MVKDLQFVSAREEPTPIAYLDFWQQDRTDNRSQDSFTHLRVSGDAAAMLPQIRRTIAAIDPDVPVSELIPLGARLDHEFSNVRAARTLLVSFGALALVLVFRRGTAIVLLGVAAGLGASAIAGPLLAHLLYGVSPHDPVALLAGSLLGAVALLAIWLPARRAMAMDPAAALRSE